MASYSFERFIAPSEERLYFTIPFEVPENAAALEIAYDYPRYRVVDEDGMTRREEINIIDLALNAPGGEYVGASGSDRSRVVVSAAHSSQGYARVPVRPGAWEIIVGAYKVAPEGVTVRYTVTTTDKALRLYRGDVHTHTTASDGALTSEELVVLCRQQHLDYVFVTNHNNYAENFNLPHPEDITVIPGTEWTHYKGHANFLGVARPYRNPFCVNTPERAAEIIGEARAAGATIVVNHPFCAPECGWAWGMDLAPFDAVEVWNGPLMYENENAACLAWWHEQLAAGRRVPVTGGSDFHRTGPLSLPGVPCTCLYAPSREPEDLLAALRAGHGYVKMFPDAPDLEARAGDAILGDAAPAGTPVEIHWTGLRAGDTLRAITGAGVVETRACPPGVCAMRVTFRPGDARFVRFEALRPLSRGLPALPVLVSNPIYFDA